MELKFHLHWSIEAAIVAVSVVAGYLAARGLAVKPRKA
jgi:hypothetical protein